MARPCLRRSISVITGLAIVTGVAACGSGTSVTLRDASVASASGASAPASAAPSPEVLGSVGTVAAGPHGTLGLGRDMPPIPDIAVPDVSSLTGASQKIGESLKDLRTPITGITVTGARCDADGQVVNSSGLTVVAGADGSGVAEDPTRRIVTGADGSGTYDDTGTRIVVGADGSGTYDDGTTRIVIADDGSGTYDDTASRIVLGADGSGTYDDGTTRIVIGNDGSGTYDGAGTRIVNSGDGSGTYDDATVRVVNDGHGAGHVSTATTELDTPMDPLPPLQKVGRFPSVASIRPPGTACGTLIRLEDRVLFDFDKATLRTEAGPVLDQLAGALGTSSDALRISGYTDALGTDAYNLDLSRRRAQAVADALVQRGVSAPQSVTGLGETRPIAPNSIGGVDNPAGRQQNRRVEIVVGTG